MATKKPAATETLRESGSELGTGTAPQSPLSRLLRMTELVTQLERELDRTLSHLRGISYSEYRLLLELSTSVDQRATRVDLAAAVALTPSAVTRALKPLEKLGYVESAKSERDARRSFAILTPQGRQLVNEAQAALVDVVGQLPLNDEWDAPLARLREHLRPGSLR